MLQVIQVHEVIDIRDLEHLVVQVCLLFKYLVDNNAG